MLKAGEKYLGIQTRGNCSYRRQVPSWRAEQVQKKIRCGDIEWINLDEVKVQ